MIRMLRYRTLRVLEKMLFEAGVAVAALYIAFLIRFEWRIPPNYLGLFGTVVLPFAALRVGSLYTITRGRLRWRSTTLSDIEYIGAGILLGSFCFIAFLAVAGIQGFPRSVLVTEAVFTLNGLLALRLTLRCAFRYVAGSSARPAGSPRRVLIVGAGAAGERIARAMREDAVANLKPIGYVDDDPSKRRQLIDGLSVLGGIDDVPRLVQSHDIDQILIAIPSLPPSGLRRTIERCRVPRVELTVLPSLPEMLSRTYATRAIRKVRVEDLLEREPVIVDVDTIASYTTGERILVTGAGGSIGSELCRQIIGLRPEKLILLDQSENNLYWIDQELRTTHNYRATTVVADIKDREKLASVFAHYRPTVVFHAAAYKHVPLMEGNPEEAIKNNVFGTRNLAEMAVLHKVHTFVMISTDKAVNPTSVMGASKRVAESIVQSMAQRIAAAHRREPVPVCWGFPLVMPEEAVTRFSSVRFGNVLGSNGSVIPTMQRQIEKGGPVTVTHPEMVRFFMTIPEAVQLVIQAGAIGRGGEIFVLDMGKPVKIMDLARNLIRLSGYEPDEDIRIAITGVRPGEKLYEEVLTAEEGVTMTSHRKIHAARSLPVDHAGLGLRLRDLERCIQLADPGALQECIRDLVPTYTGCFAGAPRVDVAAAAAARTVLREPVAVPKERADNLPVEGDSEDLAAFRF